MGCLQIEDQIHTFIGCTKLEKINTPVVYDHIFGTLFEQESTIKVFMKKDTSRNHIKKNHILPGGKDCQDPCTFSSWNGAAFVSINSMTYTNVMDVIKKKYKMTVTNNQKISNLDLLIIHFIRVRHYQQLKENSTQGR